MVYDCRPHLRFLAEYGANAHGRRFAALGAATLLLAAILPMSGVGLTESSTSFNATALDAGGGKSCAVLDTGDVHCWSQFSGRMEYTGGNAVKVATYSAFYNRGCVLLDNGNIHCWGQNTDGQSEDYDGGKAVDVAVDLRRTCAVFSDGTIDCWGEENLNTNDGQAIQVSMDGPYTCVLRTTGNVWCMDHRFTGFNAWTEYTGEDATQVSRGQGHTCVLLERGDIKCSGDNDSGQAEDYGGGDAVQVSAGRFHTCALLSNGDIKCWGLNTDGQSEDYSGGDAVEVSAGRAHTCARLINGNVICWGAMSRDRPDVPTPPFIPAVERGPGPGELSLEWTYPRDDGTLEVTAYDIYRASSSGGPYAHVAQVGTQRTYKDTGLADDTEYFYVVTATNAEGESGPSSERSGITPAIPTAPRDLLATQGEDEGEIELRWNEPDSDGGLAVTGYVIYRTESEGGSYSEIDRIGAQRSYTDTGLDVTTTYHYRVSALNDVGEGPFSNEASTMPRWVVVEPPALPPMPTPIEVYESRETNQGFRRTA